MSDSHSIFSRLLHDLQSTVYSPALYFIIPGPTVAPTHGSKGGVSHKIQQLLNTLKRPKKNRRPIEEYYQEEDMSKSLVWLPII